MKKPKQIRLFAVLSAAAILIICATGCVSATGVAHNEGMTIDFDASQYGIVYYLPPEDDPRGLAPKIENEFKKMGFLVNTMDREKPLEGAQGSGFWIADGYVLTCAHVLDDAVTATLWGGEQRYEADLVAKDADVDLALLKVRRPMDPSIRPLQLESPQAPAMGDDVFTIGFPLATLLGDQARLTKGLVSATQGVKGNPAQFQITAAIQPGSSGGPVFDEKGRLRGVVTQTLNTLSILKSSGGAAPQNVNFALKPEKIAAFLDTHLPGYMPPISVEARDIASIEKAALKVQSGILPPHLEGKAKLVVLFDYNGFWDIWYRFNVFLISAFDFDSGERIFSAGQIGDNLISNEEVVVRDTLKEIRTALGREEAR